MHDRDPGSVSDGSRLASALYQTLSLSIECPSSIFFWHVLVVLHCFCLVFMLSLELCRRCSSDLFLSSRPRTVVPDWKPGILLGISMVGARSVNNVPTVTKQLSAPFYVFVSSFSCFFGDVPFSECFCTLAVFSLNGEYVVRFPPPA